MLFKHRQLLRLDQLKGHPDVRFHGFSLDHLERCLYRAGRLGLGVLEHRGDQHPTPGNVRELENVIERATNLAMTELIEPSDLALEIRQRGRLSAWANAPEPRTAPDLGTHEMNAIIAALKDTRGNIRLAAQRLNVSRGGLYNKMSRFGLKVEAFRS